MPIDLLIYMVIAAVLIFWLRNTLGTRHGEERDRSADIEASFKNAQANQEEKNGDIKDILDHHHKDQTSFPAGIDGDIAQDITNLMRQDSSFDPKHFVEGAKDAFVLIVEAFARGDLRVLKDLLSPGVYKAFEQAIEDRDVKGDVVSTEVHAVKNADILSVSFLEKMVFIKIRFLADETCVIKDREGTILSGHPDRITTMNDVWTFGREIKSKNPTWYLFETADDVEEDHKTPIPDSHEGGNHM